MTSTPYLLEAAPASLNTVQQVLIALGVMTIPILATALVIFICKLRDARARIQGLHTTLRAAQEYADQQYAKAEAGVKNANEKADIIAELINERTQITFNESERVSALEQEVIHYKSEATRISELLKSNREHIKKIATQHSCFPDANNYSAFDTLQFINAHFGATRNELAEAKQHIELMGGYHERTQRETEISERYFARDQEEKPMDDRDLDIEFLLNLVDAGRNAIFRAEAALEVQAQTVTDHKVLVAAVSKHASELRVDTQDCPSALQCLLRIAETAQSHQTNTRHWRDDCGKKEARIKVIKETVARALSKVTFARNALDKLSTLTADQERQRLAAHGEIEQARGLLDSVVS